MNKSDISNYIVYVNYQTSSNASAYNDSTIKSDSLSNILKNNTVMIYKDSDLECKNICTPNVKD